MIRRQSVQAYLTRDEKAALKRLMDAEGLSESSFTRRLLLGYMREKGATVQPVQPQPAQQERVSV